MRDARYAIRVLLKAPIFTVTAVLTLALCIGATTAIYTVVDRVLLRPLPYPEPERLAQVTTHFEPRGNDEVGQTGATWELLREHVRTLDLATSSGGFSAGVNLVAGTHAESVNQRRVSAGFFAVLGVRPVLGREFNADEDRPNGPAAAVLGYSLWMRLFNGDPAAIGRSLTLRGEPHTIVGVMPPGFGRSERIDLWTPVRPCRTCEGGGQNYGIIARLRPGVTWAQADAEVATVGEPAMADLYRSSSQRARLHIVPLHTAATATVRRPILILWAAVAAVLLIGCVNVAGLLLARGASRAPEIATRLALGSGGGAVVRQLLTESLVLAACGGAVGIALGFAASRLFATLLQDAFGVTAEMGLDGRVFAVTSAIALGTSILFGLVPALQISRVDPRETLADNGTRTVAGSARSWPRRAMIVTEVALGIVLLVGAGLLIRTLDHLMRLPPGFDGTHVMTATLSLQDSRYQTLDEVNTLLEQSTERLRRVAGVDNAAVCLTLPYERALNLSGRWVSAKPGAPAIELMNLTYVTGGYFDTLRISLIRGRYIDDRDVASSEPVIVVNQSFVRRYSPDEDPIGRQIAASGTSRRVIGVVGDIQQSAGFGNYGPLGSMPATYIPASQTNESMLKLVHTWFSPSWLVRATGTPTAMASEMQRALAAVDPLLPIARFRTFDEVRRDAVATQRAQALLFGLLAALGLLLSAIGVYGLVANSVAERTRELAIRLALGATVGQTILAAAGPGLVLAASGVAIGLAAARLGATTMRHLVWGVAVTDSVTFATATAAVLLVAVIASLVPAIWIVRLNPMRALRAS
jgi:predicted permease